jgi:hypothetical protein
VRDTREHQDVAIEASQRIDAGRRVPLAEDLIPRDAGVENREPGSAALRGQSSRELVGPAVVGVGGRARPIRD